MKQLLEAADRLAEAAVNEIEDRRARKEMNEEMIEALPERDRRGSRDWWAAFCRQYTGASMLDSGSYYGYGYNSPVGEQPLYVDVHQGRLEGFTVNTIDFLYKLLDATDPVALAIEELLYWYGNNVAADRSWCETDHEFAGGVLSELVGLVSFDLEREEAEQDIEAYLKSQRPKHFDGSTYRGKTEGLPEGWFHTLPWADLQVVAEAGCVEPGSLSGNTYNYSNNLDQILQFDSVTVVKGYQHHGDHYIILQAHTGCDARGGYTRPVVSLVRDHMYFRFLYVDLDCRECNAMWERDYFYTEKLKGIDKPAILVEKDSEWVPLGEDASGLVPYNQVRLLCPECGEYAVTAYNPVLGF